MLKFESIIRNLSLDEKISFITSTEKYKSMKVENYDLPTFEVKKAHDLTGVKSDLKISYKSLLSTWGINYAHKYFSNIYESINSFNTIFGIEIKDNSKRYIDGIYPDNYLLGSFSKLEIEAINSKGYFSCITDFPRIYYDKFDFNDVTPYLIALSGNPSSIVLKTKDSLDFVNKNTGFNGFKFFEAADDLDSIYALNNGAIFVFYENAKEAILSALDRYDVELDNLNNGIITNAEFEALKDQGLILSSEMLDKIVNDNFSMLLKLDDSFKISSRNKEEINETEATSDICEAITLLKNVGTLPIEGQPKVGIIGDFASRFNYLDGFINFNDIIEKYGLNITGYAHGFIEENIDLEDVYLEAERVASESEYVLLFLGKYNSKSKVLPKKELDLIEKLRKYDCKIIAISNTDDYVEYSFIDKVDALIQTNILNKFGLNAVFDVIFGINIPSGRTTRYYDSLDEGKDEVLNKQYEYSLGYGLGYGIFDYSTLDVAKKGAMFTVKNSGPIGSYEVAQLYVSSLDSKDINFKLCGFKKMYIEPNESIKFIIPFDEFSFKVFDVSIMKYVIKKGRYQVSICNEAGKIMLSEIVELDDYIYDDYKATNEVEHILNIKKTYQSLIEGELKNAYIKNDESHGKGKRLFIAILVGIYYNAFFGFVFVANLLQNKYLAVTVSTLILIAIFDILFVGYLVLTLRKKKAKDEYDINSDITKVIDDMDKFDLVSEVTYEKPKEEIVSEEKEETIEEIEEANEIQEVEEDSEKVYTYDKTINEEVDDNTYSKEIDFLAYAEDLTNYALNSGLIVEPRSIRSILGAIASSKMIFLKSQDVNLTIKFAEILTKYLNDEFNPINLETIDSKDKLYWQISSDDVVYRSKLANDLLQASKNNRKIYIETMYNVNVSDTSIYDDFLDYSLDPNNSVTIKLSEDESDNVLVNKNIIFLMIPNDENYLENISKKIADSAVTIELFVRENEIIQEEPSINYSLSFTLLEQKIKENREKYYIDEDNWKKLDDIEEDLANIEEFVVDNRMTLAFEKMSSIMIEAGSDLTEVLDYAIAMRIVPYIKLMKSYKNAMDESNFKNIIVNHVGDDTISVTERALKKPL